jgi:4-oxalocrotonate tautomerase
MRWNKTKKEAVMPLIQVKAIEGVFTKEQKQEIVRKLTDTMVAIEGEALRPYTVVLFEEISSGSWGVGGNTLETSDVKALTAGAK